MGLNIVLAYTHSFDCNVFGGQLWAGSGWPFWSTFAYSAALNCVQGALSSRRVAARLRHPARCHGGSIGIAAGVLGLLACEQFMDGESEDAKLGVGLASMALIGAAAAALQSAAFGMAGAVSPRLTSAMMVGQGLAGIASGAVGLASGVSRAGLAAGLSFAAAFVLAGSPALCLCAGRNPHLRPLMEAAAREPMPALQPALPPALPPACPEPCAVARPVSPPLQTPLQTPCWSQHPQGSPAPTGATPPFSASSRGSPMLLRRRSSAEILVRSAWPQALTVCFVFLVTFTVFPGVVARWTPAENVTRLIAAFQVTDFVGRMSAEVEAFKIQRGRVVSLLAASRAAFVPAFVLLERSDAPWARSSVLQFALMLAFAFSNGYVSTLSMMLGPGQAGLEADEREAVGTMMSFFLVFGIFLGSLLALPTQIGMPPVADC